MDINVIKRKMLVKYPLFGSVVANLDYVEAPGLGTAGTDGKTIYYDPNFMSGLSEEEQTFIMAHEVCHVALDHIFRSEGKDKELWNTATDAVINAYLQKDGLKIVEGGIDIPEAINYDSEEMYQKLLEEKKNNNKQNNSQGKNSTSNNENNSSQSFSNRNQNKDVGHDTHSLWEDAIKKKQEQKSSEQESKSSESQLEGSKEQDKKKESFWNKIFNRKKEVEENKEEFPVLEPAPEEKTEEEIVQDEIKRMAEAGEKKVFKQNLVERKKQLEELKQSLKNQSKMFGSFTNSVYREMDNIGVSKPLVDWRLVLREAVNLEVDWSYGNATIEDGVVIPRLEDLPKPETEIVLDTSGSINTELLKNFLRECKNILQTSKVKVGCFDTKFYGFNEIRNISDIDNMQFQGGGGTNFNAAINAFSRRVENKIIFTDGEAPMPNDVIDAIWIVFGNKKINPKGGKVIYINDNELRRLCRYQSSDDKVLRKIK